MASSNTNDVQTKILEIEIRYETAIQQLGKYRDEIDKTKQVMKDLKTAHSNGVIGTAEFQQSMSACEQQIKANQNAASVLTRQIQTQIQVEKEQEGSLKQLRAELSKATAEYDSMSRAEREGAKGQELKKKINGISSELKGAEEATDRFYRNVGNYKEAVSGLDKVEQKAKGMGKAFLGLAGITSAGAFASQVKDVGSAYADQMAKVQAVTNATSIEFAMMSKEVEYLGSTTRYTAQQAAEAMENLTRNGLSASEATGALGGTLHLAQANAIGLGEAADIVTGQLNAFHLRSSDAAQQAENLTHINDVLSYTCANSATNITLLNDSLRNTAPIAYTAGVSIDETCAALGVLADNNIKGSDAGTILRQTFNGLITESAKSKKAFNDLGIEMNITTVKNDGLVESLKKITGAGANINQLSDIFGRRAVPGVLALINSLDQLETKFDSITESAAGTTDRMFNQSYSDFTVAADSLKSAWEGFEIALWQGQNDKLRDEYLNKFEELKAQWGDQIAEAERAKSEIDALKQKQTELTLRFAEGDDSVAEEMNRLQREIQTKINALEGVSTEYLDAKAQLEAEFQTRMEEEGNTGMSGMMQGPIEELTALIQWVRANVNELGTMIMAIIAGITLTKLVNHVKTSAGQMKTDLITNANAASQNVQNLISKETMLRNQQRRQETQLAQASGQERTLIEQKLNITKEQLRINDLAKEKAKLAEQKAVQQAAAMSTATGWKAAMQSAKIAVQGFVTASKTALKSFALTAVLSLAIELIMKLWNALDSGEGVMGRIGGSIKTFIQNALQKLGQAVQAVINWFIDLYNESTALKVGIATLGGVFKAVWTVIKTGIDLVVNNFKGLAGIIKGVTTALQGLFSRDWTKAAEGVRLVADSVVGYYKNVVSTVKDSGKEIADGFVESFNAANKKIERVEFGSASGSSVTTGTSSSGNTSTSATAASESTESSSSSTGGGSGKDSKTAEKEENERRKREKLEMEALANLQNELYKIEADGAEKRRKEVESQYDKRIDKLRTQLATEKNLTSTARKAINDLIVVIEQEKSKALEKLSAEERKKEIEEEIKNNESRLNLIRKGTGAELAEKLRGLKEERDAKIKKAQEDISEESERQLQIYLINADFEQMRLDLISGALDTELGLRLANLDNKHEIAVREAQDAITVEEEKIAKLRELSKEEYDALSEEERESYDRQLQEATDALSRKQETLTLINEQYARDTTAAQEESEQQSVERQKQALEDRILMMQNDEEQRLQLIQNGRQITEEEELADQQRKLEAIGGFEAQKLQLEAEYAQQAYDNLVARGQLSTQTEEEFNREVEQARQNNLNAKKTIDDAYVKQEKAKYDSMKALTSSLTGLLDTLGEENKAFAMASKIITLAQIAIDTGRAISAGVASASSMPFPANLAAIATTVATVIANVTTAISTVKGAKFAEGGRVSGPGTGTSDSVPAMLSNGEFVMTAAATRMYEPLLLAMNNIGKGVPMQVVSSNRDAYMSESLTESFSAAVQEFQPVVSVTEINEMQTRVRTIENLDNF